jgi:hypothetical protein
MAKVTVIFEIAAELDAEYAEFCKEQNDFFHVRMFEGAPIQSFPWSSVKSVEPMRESEGR